MDHLDPHQQVLRFGCLRQTIPTCTVTHCLSHLNVRSGFRQKYDYSSYCQVHHYHTFRKCNCATDFTDWHSLKSIAQYGLPFQGMYTTNPIHSIDWQAEWPFNNCTDNNTMNAICGATFFSLSISLSLILFIKLYLQQLWWTFYKQQLWLSKCWQNWTHILLYKLLSLNFCNFYFNSHHL